MSASHDRGSSMALTLHVWRQRDAHSEGRFETYHLREVAPDMSMLEMLDLLNEQLQAEGREPVAFDHDCREGICGSCGMVINGQPHGPDAETATCQLHMRRFRDGDALTLEPFRAKSFPLVKDLVVDRSAFDAIIAAGGFITSRTGSAPEANSQLIPTEKAELSMDAAACIGCGACVAACPNASAMLFVGAKVAHLGSLPQGLPERRERAVKMVNAMDALGFGNCSNISECEAVCPKAIPVAVIASLNRDYLRASWTL